MRLPVPPVQRYDTADLPADASSAIAVTFLAIPQGLAYATIAGLPPAMGLYAAALPAVVGSLFRSSRHVLAGPTNALSLLVGTAVMTMSHLDPVTVAITLALMVGVAQVLAGVLRLGALVDYISTPVVAGYITGAGILIGIGQLYNMTGTQGPVDSTWATVTGWLTTLPDTSWLALAISVGTAGIMVLIRVRDRERKRKVPAAITALTAALVATLVFDLESHGLPVVSDIAPIPRGLPPISTPTWNHAVELIPMAIACTVLSLVESSAVARSIAARTGQRLDGSVEFVGQGLANVAAAFTTGYPVSGSLSRSALNARTGGRTRAVGIASGVLIVIVLIGLGPVLDHTPIASLAGLLMVVAWDLVDVPKIRRILRTDTADAIAFAATTVGVLVLSLDVAIYIGVGVSILLFLRRVRMLRTSELTINERGRLRELRTDDPPAARPCRRIRFLHVEGSLSFFAAGQLQAAIDDVMEDVRVRVLVIRLKRTFGMDITTATTLEAAALALRGRDRVLILAGMDSEDMQVLRRSGIADVIGEPNLFPTRRRWFEALDAARARAIEFLEEDEPACGSCPFRTDPEDGPLLPDTSRLRAL